MPERKKAKPGKLLVLVPQKIKRKSITLRLPEDDIRKLQFAAFRAGLNQTVYVQLALRAQFEKDGIQ
jgi:hypothetical protein